jgi:hypothetical protein
MEKTRTQYLKHKELNTGQRIKRSCSSLISVVILLSLIMDIQALHSKELNEFAA